MHGKLIVTTSGNRIYVDGTWFDSHGAACEPVDTVDIVQTLDLLAPPLFLKGDTFEVFAFGDTAVVHMDEQWYAMDGTPSFKRENTPPLGYKTFTGRPLFAGGSAQTWFDVHKWVQSMREVAALEAWYALGL